MLPLELTLEGFKSYREEHTFSFEGRTLFAVVGPTGAGKSSILEAIVFALFGKTVRLERDTKKLIHTGSDDARVRLIFESDGSVWEVTRVLRRARPAEVVLKRHGVQTFDASGERGVNQRIEELLGLDFKAFCSSVVLPQGEFDRFLESTPGDRSKILKGIFRLERVDALREKAREHVSELKGKGSALEAELENLGADPASIEKLAGMLAEEQDRARSIREALDDASRVQADLDRAQQTLAEIEKRLSLSNERLGATPAAEVIEETGVEEQNARQRREDSGKSLKRSSDLVAKCEKELTLAEKETGGWQKVRRARDLARDHAALQDGLKALRNQIGGFDKSLGDSQVAVEKTEEAHRSAVHALSAAKAELEALRHRHSAHLLRKDLSEGEPCPVCEQLVSKPPALARVPGLKAADAAVEACEKKAERARTGLEEARKTHLLAGERKKEWSNQVARIEGSLAETWKALAVVVGEVADPIEKITQWEARLEKARADLDAARLSLDEAAKLAGLASEEFEAVAAKRRRHAASLISVCAALGISAPDVEATTDQLLDASKRAKDSAAALIESDERKREETSKLTAGLSEALDSFRKEFGLAPSSPITQALEESNTKIGSLRKEIETAERAISRSGELQEEIERIKSRRDLYSRLWEDMADTKFVAYLLDGQRRLLSRIGSEKLYELTGRYRFDDEGDFKIVDAPTGAERTTDTLSGGETFLASLALALALAEAVSQGGGRLGCFFLDEGFGSLDPENLSVALEGIEKLAEPGRLIGLVSHVRDIQHRLDDLIVLDKNGDGTTQVVQTEGPIAYPAANI